MVEVKKRQAKIGRNVIGDFLEKVAVVQQQFSDQTVILAVLSLLIRKNSGKAADDGIGRPLHRHSKVFSGSVTPGASSALLIGYARSPMFFMSVQPEPAAFHLSVFPALCPARWARLRRQTKYRPD